MVKFEDLSKYRGELMGLAILFVIQMCIRDSVAYFVPFYLKDFVAKTPRKLL